MRSCTYCRSRIVAMVDQFAIDRHMEPSDQARKLLRE